DHDRRAGPGGDAAPLRRHRAGRPVLDRAGGAGRHTRRAARRLAPEHPPRPRHDVRRDPVRVRAELLDGNTPDSPVRRAARLAADDRLRGDHGGLRRRHPLPGAAGAGTAARRDGQPDQDDALEHARGPATRVHHARACQGTARAPGAPAPRAAERLRPGAHVARPDAGQPARRRGRHRDRDHAARARAFPRRWHLRARLPRRAGHTAAGRRALRACEPGRRRPLSPVRSAGTAVRRRRESFAWLARPNAVVGLSLLGVIGLLAIIGAAATPYDPLVLSYEDRLEAPSREHWLGTDQFGRDTFSRLAVAAGTSLTVSVL